MVCQQDSPELMEQVVLRAYLEAKREHAQLLLNAYDGLTKVTILSALTKPDYLSQYIQIHKTVLSPYREIWNLLDRAIL